MAYLICEKCGKQYPLPEGKESFNYENCSCGGRLKYSPKPGKNSPIIREGYEPIIKEGSSNSTFKNKQPFENKGPLENKQPFEQAHPPSQIKWKGVFVGFTFLFVSLILTVMITFGENPPTNPSDIPMEFLTYFSVLTIILTGLAGSISAYLSGSKKYLEGAMNGGMVGLVLGLILGLAGGAVVFISGTFIFGLISMVGGVIGVFPRKLHK